ncbi:LOW QUALITY PROTEIN: hypothetical protein U9M48_024932 [Paspalum notatum var. saurae]|uniref:Reverse transcriptase domain-containing protein n=1 Tax=Paspalum notatum var. saurae TaxID=547442 RepID=A0AAQ3TPR9_PASNO
MQNINTLKTKLAFDNGLVILAVGQSGGLWVIWKLDVDISASPNYIQAEAIYVPLAYSFTLVYIYGDPHHARTDMIWQDVFNFVANYPNTPVLCMGDMNNITNVREKLGPNPANQACISNFCAWIKYCGLFDLGYHGPAYTWTNKRFASMPTFEHLDRCLANTDWIAAFPNTSVHHLPMLYRDHCPILIKMDSTAQKIKKPFRFKNWWIQEPDFQQVAKKSWIRSRTRGFNLKTTYLAADLRSWRRKKKPNITEQLSTIENQLSIVQVQSPTLHNHRSQQMLVQQHHGIMQKKMKNTTSRGQKSNGQKWMIETQVFLFHKCILKRARKNRIPFIITQDGHTLTTNEHMADYFKAYFTNLFTSQLNDLPIQEPPTQDAQDTNTIHDAYIDSIPTAQEIWGPIKAMRNKAAPGPNGLNATFYKAAWPWIAQDVVELVTNFYQTEDLPQELNKTFITLIPKGMNANNPQSFRPISLCNVIYKIISSTIAKRIKNHLPSYIHQSQAAFIPGRHITTNIILAQEITHSFSLKT